MASKIFGATIDSGRAERYDVKRAQISGVDSRCSDVAAPKPSRSEGV